MFASYKLGLISGYDCQLCGKEDILTVVKFTVKARPLGVFIACTKAHIFRTEDLSNIFVHSI